MPLAVQVAMPVAPDGGQWAKVGVSVSFTVPFGVAGAWLPEESVSGQVTVVVRGGKLDGASLVTLADGQLAPRVGVPSATLLAVHRPASTVTVRACGAVIAGGWLSTTVTNWVHVSRCPLVSIAVQVMMVAPTG